MHQPVESPTPSVRTSKVARQVLHFQSIDDMLAEVDRLAQADRAGRLKRLGNWTLGQALGHLAAWAEFGYTGTPLKTPFIIRLLLRMRKKSFLHGKMKAGVRIPGVAGGTLATETLPLEEGLRRLREVFDRLKREAPTAPNVIFGQLTHEESTALNLRHCELHLGFFVPEGVR